MSTVLQVSDPHFGTEQPAVVEALVRLAREQRPDLVVLSGDITQRARQHQFARARAVAERLGAPVLTVLAVLAVPGNHDLPLFNVPARVLWPHRGCRRAFGTELEPAWDTPSLLVLCVNTTRPWRHKHGEVSALQAEHVARRLAGAGAAQLRVVVVHQPVAVVHRADDVNLLRWAGGACRVER